MRKLLLILLILLVQISVRAQSKRVVLQGFAMGPYWDGAAFDTTHTWGVPCPADRESLPATKQWYYDKLADKANVIAASGITAVWYPCVTKGSAGYYGNGIKSKRKAGAIYDVGYGIFDDYDLGDKLQNGSIPTRYGTREQLTRSVAVMRANGLEVYHDFVLNQRNGANMEPVAPAYQIFKYKDAFGNDNGGRFPKYVQDFHQMRGRMKDTTTGTEDPHTPATVYPDGSRTNDFETLWGPDIAHINGQKNINGTEGVWVATQLNKWGDWLLKATGMQGYRLDAVSGISWDFIKSFVNYGAMKGKYSIAEHVGTRWNSTNLTQWTQELVGEKGSNFTIFDQALQPVLIKMCKTNGFDMAPMQSKHLSYNSRNPDKSVNAINPAAGSADPGKSVWYRSLMATNPSQAVTVVNEADMETPIGTLVRAALPKECLLGYAYIFTIGYGTPCVTIKDWSTDSYCYGSTVIDAHNLNYHLNKLIWCHNFVISGGLTNEQVSSNGHVYAFQKTGGKQAMIFLNSDQDNSNPITVTTSILNGTLLTDYTDHNVKAIVKNGKITVTVPANKNGRGYLVMAVPGITGSFIPRQSSVTQEWDASADLSIPPASNKRQLVCRIWVDKNKTITSAMLDYNTSSWTKASNIKLEIDRSSADSTINMPVASRTFNSGQKKQSLVYKTPSKAGYYSIWVKGSNLPEGNNWFNLQNTYTAPRK